MLFIEQELMDAVRVYYSRGFYKLEFLTLFIIYHVVKIYIICVKSSMIIYLILWQRDSPEDSN